MSCRTWSGHARQLRSSGAWADLEYPFSIPERQGRRSQGGSRGRRICIGWSMFWNEQCEEKAKKLRGPQNGCISCYNLRNLQNIGELEGSQNVTKTHEKYTMLLALVFSFLGSLCFSVWFSWEKPGPAWPGRFHVWRLLRGARIKRSQMMRRTEMFFFWLERGPKSKQKQRKDAQRDLGWSFFFFFASCLSLSMGSRCFWFWSNEANLQKLQTDATYDRSSSHIVFYNPVSFGMIETLTYKHL